MLAQGGIGQLALSHARSVAKHAFNRRQFSTGSRGAFAQDELADILKKDGNHFDAVVIGGGMAGAAAALGLTSPQLADAPVKGMKLAPVANGAKPKRVLVLEREPFYCFHSTGRSAAIFSEVYGSPSVRALSVATKPFYYEAQEHGLNSAVPLVLRRPSVWAARPEHVAAMKEIYKTTKPMVPTLQLVSLEQLTQYCPWTRSAGFSGAFIEHDAADMDVNAIWTAMVNASKAGGANFQKDATVTSVASPQAGKGSWSLVVNQKSTDGTPVTVEINADMIVNASGAWTDEFSSMAGVPGVGMIPKQRTIIKFNPLDLDPSFLKDNELDEQTYLSAMAEYPSVFDMNDEFYYKPESGRILASPCDATPVEAAEVFPDDFDVAVCVDRMENFTPFRPKKILEKWAGLRCFVEDKEFVIGQDTRQNVNGDFWWLAGLGGYGIQTAMGNARLFSSLTQGKGVPQDLLDNGLDLKTLSPNRFEKK